MSDINGTPLSDRLGGTAGDDTISGDAGDDIIYAGEGNDTVGGDGGDDFIKGQGGDDVIVGGDGRDRISGGLGHDFILGDAGNDVLRGDAGDDRMQGGLGDDRLIGGSGADRLKGDDGNDWLFGGDGADRMWGGLGADGMRGGAGADIMSGGDGDDILRGGDNNDILYGDAGIDRLSGDAGDDTLYGGADRDVLDGGDGNDRLEGGSGDDVLKGGLGDDTALGGTGNDLLYGHDGADTLEGGDGADYLSGGRDDDILRGGAGDDRLMGNRGNDTIEGGAGNDIAEGHAGDDIFTGGAGDDRFDGGNGFGDRAVFSGNASDYQLQYLAGSGMVVVTDLRDGSPDGQDRLFNVEFLDFADGVVAVDGGTFEFSGHAPEILSGAAYSVGENALIAYRVEIRDLDGNALEIALSGADASAFNLAANGDLHFVIPPDFENPGDADGDNVYTFTLTVSDGFETVEQAVTVSVANIDEAPVFSSPASGSLAENATGVVLMAQATDPEGGTVTYSVSGDDAAFFAIDAATGELSFLSPPDYDLPADADGDNVYDIVITASDGVSTTDQSVLVQVTDVDDGVFGTAGNDSLAGTAEGDAIFGRAGRDIIFAGAGNDMVDAGDGNDIVFGETGDDMLEGGAGDDFLFGGDGEDTAVYSGNAADYTVTLRADGAVTVTDNRAASPDGTDTLLGVETLSFADGDVATPQPPAPPAHPNALAFLFPSSAPWAPLPAFADRPEGPVLETLIYVSNSRTVSSDEFYIALQDPNVVFEISGGATLNNDGVVWAEGDTRVRFAVSGEWGWVSNDGTIISLSRSGNAFAVSGPYEPWNGGYSMVLDNRGTVIAVSATRHATGFSTGADVRANGDHDHANSGLIEAWAGQVAHGVVLKDRGNFDNSGIIRASGADAATAILVETGTHYNGSRIDNSGLIEAISRDGLATGIEMWGPQIDLRVTNSGTIRAEQSIYISGRDGWNGSLVSGGAVTLSNTQTGIIEGDSRFEDVSVTMTNEGLIIGDVDLGNYDDSFVSDAGVLIGTLDLGAGDDVAQTGSANDTVFGGSGNDSIQTGAGDDILGGGLGVDTLDGGAGSDTADFTRSSVGVEVDLGAGTADGGDATGDTLINIENLSGSLVDDILAGDSGDNTIAGNAGQDVLRGGGGNDLLDGGDGFDTAVFSGNQADYEITSLADGSVRVRDLRDGSPDGADILVGIERIEFADGAIGDAAPAPVTVSATDVLFASGGTPWAALPDYVVRAAGVPIEAPVQAFFDFVLADGEAIIARNEPNLAVAGGYEADFTNNGLIWVESSPVHSGAVAISAQYGMGIVTNSGMIVALSPSAQASAVNLSDGILHNTGIIFSGAVQALSTAFRSGGAPSGFASADHTNSGTIEAWGLYATAVRLSNGGNLENSGTVRALGQDSATAIDIQYQGGLVENSGLIEAVSDGVSFGIRLTGQLDNSGTIRADTAVASTGSFGSSDLVINNMATGRIEGDIDLTGTSDTITNEGLITGDVSLGSGNDSFTQAGGTLEGALDLGSGNDIADMSAHGDTVFGGAGDDTIRTLGGSDWIEGGAGADLINGGNGVDTASYASSATTGVNVDLAAGTASGGDAEGDTLIGIENLSGSLLDDTLAGDDGDNVLRGDAGQDTLSGGGGNDTLDGGADHDTVVYAGNMSDYQITENADGSRTVLDLRTGSPDGEDLLVDIERIEFADGAIGDLPPPPPGISAESYLYPNGGTPWTPLPDIPDRPDVPTLDQPVSIGDNLTITADENYIMSDNWGEVLSSNGSGTLTNEGLIWLEHYSGTAAINGGGNTIVNSGMITAISRGTSIYGIFLSSQGNVTNDGAFYVASLGYGTGIYASSGDYSNNGTMEVWSNAYATGIRIGYGGNVTNAGTLVVQGRQSATGIQNGSGEFSVINSGTIEVVHSGGNSRGVFNNSGAQSSLENSGTIRADTAIAGHWKIVTNTSTGLIDGDVVLDRYSVTFINEGVITGNVDLGSGNNNYTQTIGELQGILDLGAGNDTAVMGATADIVFGGDGDDDIRTAGGRDRLAGGAGADYLHGGTGLDLADYSTSSAGVSIDLGAGTASGGDATGDTLVSIEGLIGSAYDDTLTGDGGDNVFYASGGTDVIDGGAGTDTVYFSGQESDYTVTTDGNGNSVYTDNRAGSPDGVTTLIGIETISWGVSASAEMLGGKDPVAEVIEQPGNKAGPVMDELELPDGFHALSETDALPRLEDIHIAELRDLLGWRGDITDARLPSGIQPLGDAYPANIDLPDAPAPVPARMGADGLWALDPIDGAVPDAVQLPVPDAIDGW